MNNQPILYAEDEENDVFLMRHAWKSVGVLNPLKVVTDGEQAVQYLSGEGMYADRDEYPLPCLILLDLKLPRLHGLDVLKWIRQQPALHLLPVIVFSSSNNPQDVCRAYELRANAYLVKPSHTEGLVELVASLRGFWLGRNQLPPAS
jgi:CheY-like chemotaxis protein